MGGLFSKLLLWFWLALLATVLALVLTQRYWLPGGGLPDAPALREAAEELTQLHREEGFGGAMGYLRSLSREQRVRFFLLPPDSDHRRSRRLPAHLREHLDTVLAADQSAGPLKGFHFRRTEALIDGESWHLLALSRSRGLQDLPVWVQLLVALAITGVIASLLALSLSVPIRRIRRATRRLAAGELDYRLPVPASGGDEIAALGRDFNAMAERLQSLLEGRTELLRNISHELRSPLARLQVALELARERSDDNHLDRMERDIERLDTLIAQILELSRLETGGPLRRRESVAIAELLDEVCEDAAFEARTEDKAVQRNLVGGRIRGDRELLRSALDNVIRNALHHTPPGLAVGIEGETHGEGLVLRVRDRGPGVPETKLDEVFQPFVRVSRARERESGGYGLGLAIARRAILAHGGTIRAANRTDGGLEVTIELPLERGSDLRARP